MTRGVDRATLDIRVMPRSSRTSIDGMRDGRLVIRVTAPPIDDAANEAVVELLARTFRLPRRAISIVAGATGRNKTIAFDGLSAQALRQWLNR